ncbi:MAG: hypothetical protein IJP34_04015 [Clostridia bacterium]|nr:hypothetical protein [Clostridia bacterium]
MFKKLSCILLIVVVSVSLAACKKSKDIDNNISNSIPSKLSETVSTSEEEKEIESNIVFNEEILENFGLTYKALTEKYGTQTEVMRYEAAPHLRFKNYLDWGGMVFKGYESYDADYSKISDNSIVDKLTVKVGEAFENDKRLIYFWEIEELFDCTATVTLNEMTGGHLVEFKYKEYNFTIYAATPEYLEFNDVVFITK